MKKQIVRLTESDLHRIIKESVNKIINESGYVSMKHSGHNLDDFLDDNDFMTIVNRVAEMYGIEDFDANDQEYLNDIEMDIAKVIKDFVEDEAVDNFGYKYGTTNYRSVASNVIEYIQSHPEMLTESGINIDPKNKGKFTATKKRTGKSTEELTHSKNPLTRKRAMFAKMAKRGWKPLKKN